MANAPPYSKFIAIILEGREKSSLYRTGYNVSTQLKKCYPEGLKIFGPALAPISRVKRKIRVRLLIQCKKQLVSNELFRKALLASNIPKSQKQALYDLKMSGITPIIAHPERYKLVQENFSIVYDLSLIHI